MRIVAMTDDTPGTLFTAGGTLAILFSVTVAATPLAVIYLAVRRVLRGSDLRRGALYGAIIAAPGVALAAGEAFQIGILPLNLVMFGGLFVLYGIVLSVTMSALERRIGRPGDDRRPAPRAQPPVESLPTPSTR
jgi:hypothetical protein